jgi:hypothetical protein
LDPRVPDKIVMIAQDLTSEEETELLSFLEDFRPCVSTIIIEHKLNINPSAKPRKQKLRKMSDEKIAAAKAEVQRLLDACFI